MANPAKTQTDMLTTRVEGLEHRINALQEQLDRSTLIIQALWELLGAHEPSCDEDALSSTMARILEEKQKKEPAPCPACSRPVSIRTNRCVYCGVEVPKDTVF